MTKAFLFLTRDGKLMWLGKPFTNMKMGQNGGECLNKRKKNLLHYTQRYRVKNKRNK